MYVLHAIYKYQSLVRTTTVVINSYILGTSRIITVTEIIISVD